MEQPNAGSFWKDRYASHPGAGAEEPRRLTGQAANEARADAARAYRRDRRAGFPGVQPMGGHHGGHHGGPAIADGGGYGPPPPGSRPQTPAPGGGMMAPGMMMDGPAPQIGAPQRGAPPPPMTRPPAMAPGGGGGGMAAGGGMGGGGAMASPPRRPSAPGQADKFSRGSTAVPGGTNAPFQPAGYMQGYQSPGGFNGVTRRSMA